MLKDFILNVHLCMSSNSNESIKLDYPENTAKKHEILKDVVPLGSCLYWLCHNPTLRLSMMRWCLACIGVGSCDFQQLHWLNKDGWTDFVKAGQLVASLRGSAAEVPQGIPADKLTELTTIEKALESGFGDSHLTQFYRTELKTRESLQVLAADVVRLMNLAYAECPLDVRDSLAVLFFVDAIRDGETQPSTK
ncbi:hypothetical protein AVEN_172869-1 [Araneus ventricosus]|uniref:Uncharacterized protein n=2 Tax=Araneus ventricosus TaxID=182803 RepID=A0A4Y2X3F4_ARAVE|nr:hypothetical protein AVEN_172869-1 [Araneus ventricosus]